MAHSAARPSGLTSARRVLGSSCGRALRASAPSIIIAAILVAAQAGLSTVSPLMLQRIIDSLTQNPSTADVLLQAFWPPAQPSPAQQSAWPRSV